MAIRMKGDSADEKMLLDAFRVFDLDANGSISIPEFKNAMKQIQTCSSFTEEEIDEIIQEFDKDGDGQVNYEGRF